LSKDVVDQDKTRMSSSHAQLGFPVDQLGLQGLHGQTLFCMEGRGWRHGLSLTAWSVYQSQRSIQSLKYVIKLIGRLH